MRWPDGLDIGDGLELGHGHELGDGLGSLGAGSVYQHDTLTRT